MSMGLSSEGSQLWSRRGIAGMFETAAQKFPEQTAIEHGDASCSYRELNAQANHLAKQLSGRMATAPGPVGILAKRSIDMVVAVLATLKLGCGYVPLDPMYPHERLRFMLENSGCSLLLAHDELVPLAESFSGEVISLGDAVRRGHLSEEADSQEAIDPSSVAYVIYTSGSTGTPKGVSMGCEPLQILLEWQENDSVVAGPLRTLQFSPLSFDVSFQETWLTLTTGGTLVLIDAEERLDSTKLRVFLEAKGIERLFLPYVALQALAEATHVPAPSSLKVVITAGEQLVVTPAIQRLFEELKGCPLYNHYGPSETHVVTSYLLSGSPVEWPRLPPIGSAVNGALLYILDEGGKEVAPGESGELYIGGTSLASGYVNNEELTRERFLPDRFAAQGRMYRTGDMVRALDSGGLQYLGRQDSQVRIRGFRVELGEVEAGVMSHTGIAQVAVTARQDGDRPRRLVAYVVRSEGGDVGLSDLRRHLEPLLPDYMLPSTFVFLEEMPRTPSGKIDRKALPTPEGKRPELNQAFVPPSSPLGRTITEIWCEILELDRVGLDDDFFELGGSSLLALRFVRELSDRTGLEPGIAQLFDRTTPRALVDLLEGATDDEDFAVDAKRRAAQAREHSLEPIAIIGWAGRFPGSDNVEEFYEALCEGREGVTFFRKDQLDPRIPPELTSDPNYVCARGVVKGYDEFDASFFGISPREAEMLDPQQRLLLELSWQGLEDAACDPEAVDGNVGVFAGVMNNTYYSENVVGHPAVDSFGAFNTMVANEKDYVATRISHRLDLKGPSISVHTACSTSLVAVHMAAQSLRSYECDVAIAGGAAVTVPTISGYLHNEGSMLSADGHCRPFDAQASGTTFGDGAGVVVLRRLSDAVREGDQIHALIIGSAVSNDGAGKASFTAPSLDGQSRTLISALASANIPPASVGYIETHGTATPIGDPIEVAALVKAYSRDSSGGGKCAIGSVKSNVGHLTAAAGVTGLIKAALAVEHDTIPPTLHYRSLNPSIKLGSHFFIADKLTSFSKSTTPRRAGVSAMGVGGTNAHVLLEEAPVREQSGASRSYQLLQLSAQSEAGLIEYARSLESALSRQSPKLADVAYSLSVGRKALRFRKTLVVDSLEAARTALIGLKKGVQARPREVAFIFPGQGAQYPKMALGLYETETTFRAAMDQCAAALEDVLDVGLIELIAGEGLGTEEAAARLQMTCHAQPALFAVEYSLAQLMMSWGVEPVAMVGHSVGEFVAATIAGVFHLNDAIRLVAERGRVMQSMPAGSMLSVRAAAADVEALLAPQTEIAAFNGKALVVVAGPDEALSQVATAVEGAGYVCKKLRTSHAFHSWMMDPAVELLGRALESIELREPKRRFVSTATGKWIQPEEATSRDYWASHLRAPVRFTAALQTLGKDEVPFLLELGPGASIAALARQSLSGVLSTASALGRGGDTRPESQILLQALGALWEHGVPISGRHFYHYETRLRVKLPPRPLHPKRHWLEPADRAAVAVSSKSHHDNPSGNAPVSPSLSPSLQQKQRTPSMENHVSEISERSALSKEILRLLEDASGFDLSDADDETSFPAMGLDSLLLTQAALTFKKTFQVKVTFRQLSDDLATIGQLSDYLLPQLSSDLRSSLVPQAPVEALGGAGEAPAVFAATDVAAASTNLANGASPVPGTLPSSLVESGFVGTALPVGPQSATQALVQQQLVLMTRQLELLGGGGGPIAAASIAAAATQAPTNTLTLAAQKQLASTVEVVARPAAAQDAASTPKTFGAQAKIEGRKTETDAATQQKVDAFIERYVSKTKKSKAYAAQHRPHLADPRVVSGFRPNLKEITYPIVVERSKGSRLWDIDGNELVDITCGFGTNFLGHSPDFVNDAVKVQLDRGVEIGPQNPLAGEVALLMAEMVKMDRVALCNTGSEAVLGALRLARTVTGNSLVVMFNGAYHGIVDEVIVRGTPALKSFPAAPGIPKEAVANTLILDYGDPESLRIIRERAHELAAVMVEPVQSRHPDLQPGDFLRELRKITEETETALIFDEVITGFRIAPGGAQEHFGVAADLATYGKIIGGGMPIGAIAGKREYMDALDGGAWQFGDNSIPEVGVTYFAGTFVRHPLALAASKAALSFLKSEGPSLQERINRKTDLLVADLNNYFASHSTPVHIENFGSLFKIHLDESVPLGSLFFHALRARMVHVWEGRPSFITYAHTDEDVVWISRAFKEASEEMQSMGIFPPLPGGTSLNRNALESSTGAPRSDARLGRDPDGTPAWFCPDPDRLGKFIRVASA